MSFAQLPDRLIARIAAFSLVGAVNTIIGVAVILIAGLLGADPIWANVLGYGAGLLISFTLNSRVTFGSRTVNRATILRFLSAFGVAFAVNLAIVKSVVGLTGAHRLLSSLVGTPFYMGIFYILCEYWVFRSDGDS